MIDLFPPFEMIALVSRFVTAFVVGFSSRVGHFVNAIGTLNLFGCRLRVAVLRLAVCSLKFVVCSL